MDFIVIFLDLDYKKKKIGKYIKISNSFKILS